MENQEMTKFEKMQSVMRKQDYFSKALEHLENTAFMDVKSPVEKLAWVFKDEFKEMMKKIGANIQKEFNEIMGE